MNFNSHHLLTEIICEKMNLSKYIGDEGVADCVKYSSFPDYVSDIFFKIGTLKKNTFLGNDLSALTHFCKMKNMKSFGYCMNKDGSIAKLKKLEIASIIVKDMKWNEVLTLDRTIHPVQELLSIEGYTKDLFKFTFSSASIMGEWICNNKIKKQWWKAASCVGHLACDVCIRDHCWCTLANGHSVHEATVEEYLIKNAERIYDRTVKDRKVEVFEPRKIIEMQAEKTGAWSGRPSNEWVIKSAFSALQDVFACFLEKT